MGDLILYSMGRNASKVMVMMRHKVALRLSTMHSSPFFLARCPRGTPRRNELRSLIL